MCTMHQRPYTKDTNLTTTKLQMTMAFRSSGNNQQPAEPGGDENGLQAIHCQTCLTGMRQMPEANSYLAQNNRWTPKL